MQLTSFVLVATLEYDGYKLDYYQKPGQHTGKVTSSAWGIRATKGSYERTDTNAEDHPSHSLCLMSP